MSRACVYDDTGEYVSVTRVHTCVCDDVYYITTNVNIYVIMTGSVNCVSDVCVHVCIYYTREYASSINVYVIIHVNIHISVMRVHKCAYVCM